MGRSIETQLKHSAGHRQSGEEHRSERSGGTPRRRSQAQSMIELRDVRIAYERRRQQHVAVEDISLKVGAGEFVAILGPSGCGKSTLLRSVAGLHPAASGEQILANPDGGPPESAMVFQDDNLFPWMKIIDNVSFGPRVRGVGKAARRHRALIELEKVGLGEYRNVYPKQLSGGMRQRANLARAFANDPDLLLMDEPFAALDVQTRVMMQQQLLQLWEEDRRTVLFVTHSIEEAMVLADRIVIMTAGPGRLLAEHTVPFRRPRDVAELTHTQEFVEMHRQIWGKLKKEVERAFEESSGKPKGGGR